MSRGMAIQAANRERELREEIARLKKENERMRDALECIAKYGDAYGDRSIAEAALRGDDGEVLWH